MVLNTTLLLYRVLSFLSGAALVAQGGENVRLQYAFGTGVWGGLRAATINFGVGALALVTWTCWRHGDQVPLALNTFHTFLRRLVLSTWLTDDMKAALTPQHAGVVVQTLSRIEFTYLLSGVLGAVFVSTTVICIDQLGSALFFSLSTLGKILASLAFDHYGWYRFEQRSVTWTKIMGVVILLAGIVIMQGLGQQQQSLGYSILFSSLSLAVGMLAPWQGAINKNLARHVPYPLMVGVFSFVTGFVLLVVVAFLAWPSQPWTFTLAWPDERAAAVVEPANLMLMWLGGMFGAFYVWTLICVPPHIGIAQFMILHTVGNLVSAWLNDLSGLLAAAAHTARDSNVILGMIMAIIGAIVVSVSNQSPRRHMCTQTTPRVPAEAWTDEDMVASRTEHKYDDSNTMMTPAASVAEFSDVSQPTQAALAYALNPRAQILFLDDAHSVININENPP